MSLPPRTPNGLLQHKYSKVPVTAVALLDDTIILAGEGPVLTAYRKDSGTRLGSCHAFKSQCIHGIVLSDNNNNIAIFGGSLIRSIVICLHGNDSIEFRLGPQVRADDWILDANFSEGPCPGLVLVTAHSALLYCDLDLIDKTDQDAAAQTVQTLAPGSNCILYSANVNQLSDSFFLIASGTAFGDIIVWSHDKVENVTKTHYTFPAHEGSVFDVQLSRPLPIFGAKDKSLLLASCSDDRTIRVWNVSDLTIESDPLTKVQQETGFGERSQTTAQSPPCLAQVMAHVSRIWKVQFQGDYLSQRLRTSNGEESRNDVRITTLRSFGEDATTIEWMLLHQSNNEKPSSFVLKQISTCSPHTGKNIWSAAFSMSVTVTGAADGSVGIIPSRSLSDHHENTEFLFDEPMLKDGHLRAYTFVGLNHLVCTDNRGKLLELRLDGSVNHAIQEIPLLQHIEELRGYSIMASDAGIAFIGSSRGLVYAYSTLSRKVYSIANAPGKITGLFTGKCEQSPLLITSVGSALGTLLSLDRKNGGDLSVNAKSLIQMPANRVVTSFDHVKLYDQAIAIVGTRDGSIVVFQILQAANSSSNSEVALDPSKLHTNVHQGQAVTSLSIESHRGRDQCGSKYVFSTGRDGTLAIHKLNSQGRKVCLSKTHQLSTSIGTHLEGLNLTNQGTVYAWGFKKDKFVAYNLTLEREVMTVECGGMHRNWCFQPDEHGGTLVWTRASKEFWTRQSSLPWQSIHGGGHGREIKCVDVRKSDPQIVATGAEDTNIKLSTLDNGDMACIHTLRKHNTGIQGLRWSEDGSYLFSSGGFEEFYAWRISSGIPGVGLGVICESTHPNSGKSDLRIMGFEVRDDPDVLSGFIISMCYSDSSLKIWGYSQSSQWRLLGSSSYLTSCLTNAFHTNGKLVTSASDGHLVFWEGDVSSNFNWTQRCRVHQNAILAFTQHILSDGTIVLITGGDDNAIGLTRYRGHDEISTLLISRAHAAAVTAITTLESPSKNDFYIISAGVDQKVAVWRVIYDANASDDFGISIRRIAGTCTAIADVSSISAIKFADEVRGILICGVGMDLWRLQESGGWDHE